MSTAEFDTVVPLSKAAELACCHPQTLRKAIRKREIEIVRRGGAKRGRIFLRLSAIDRWLKRQTVPASRVQAAV